MKKYMLTIFQPSEGVPAPEVLEPIMRDVGALHEAMKAAGVLVFTGGLEPPSAATVFHARGGKTLVTDGPFIETKDQMGGFTVIEVESRDAAAAWACKLAVAITLPIELREFRH